MLLNGTARERLHVASFQLDGLDCVYKPPRLSSGRFQARTRTDRDSPLPYQSPGRSQGVEGASTFRFSGVSLFARGDMALSCVMSRLPNSASHRCDLDHQGQDHAMGPAGVKARPRVIRTSILGRTDLAESLGAIIRPCQQSTSTPFSTC